MNRADLLEALSAWVLRHGFAHHSLAKLAAPLKLSKGALSHYFSEEKGGIKVGLGRQLLGFVRDRRRRYLVYPVLSMKGGVRQKQRFFAEQMAHYLERSHATFQAPSWSCPAFLLENELRSLVPSFEKDSEYLALIEELWRKGALDRGISPSVEQIERLLSGPYPPQGDAVRQSLSATRSAEPAHVEALPTGKESKRR